MAQGFTDFLQESRLTIVDVDVARGRLRVRGEADACSDLSCGPPTIVLTEDGAAGLAALHPGDTVKIEPAADRPQRIVVLRRAWDETASPEI
jgi:hypothetical protein